MKQTFLWILIDNYGRIYYTGGQKSFVEHYKQKMNYNFETQIIPLIGEYKHVS